MGSEALEDLCELIVDCPHKTAPISATPFAYAVGTAAIGDDGGISFDKARPVDADTYERWTARATPRAGDLIFCREAPVGPVAIVPGNPLVCLGQRTMMLRPRPDRVDPVWLAYLLRAPTTLAELLAMSEGSTVAHLNVADVRRFVVAVPPLQEQRAITSVLGALDDKIESNRRLALRLVDMIDLSYSRCIRGAPMGTLADLGTVVGGGTPKSAVAEFWSPAEVPWITPKDMTALGGVPVVWSGERSISETGLNSSSAKRVPVGSVLFTSRATLGLIAVAQNALSTNQGFITVVPVAPYSPAIVYSTLKHHAEAIKEQANGSTFLEVNKMNFKKVECPTPSKQALVEFDAVATPGMRQVAALVAEARTLKALRDALLPKLVSGQIRIPLSGAPEEALGAAVEDLEPSA